MLDYLIVGSGLYGSVLARELQDAGKQVKIIEKRKHIGGNCYTENVRGIHVHKYGPHYFHTNKKNVWDYVNRYGEFYNTLPRVKVCHQGSFYSFPVNLFTLHQIYGVKTPVEASKLLESLRVDIPNPRNLEEFVISKIGKKLYKMFYEGYSTKQWGRHPSEVPATVGRRIPIRLSMDDTYHADTKYQGIPVDGYTSVFERMLSGVNIELNVDFEEMKSHWQNEAKHLIYSGCIDSFYDYEFGRLEYRSLRHETEVLENTDYQGAGQINYSDTKIPYTRIIEHKHFQYNSADLDHTVVTKEFPEVYDGKNEPFYPVADEINNSIFQKYKQKLTPNVTIGGRLGTFKYLDMDMVISMALNQAQKLLDQNH